MRSQLRYTVLATVRIGQKRHQRLTGVLLKSEPASSAARVLVAHAASSHREDQALENRMFAPGPQSVLEDSDAKQKDKGIG